MLKEAIESEGPVAIRYPKGGECSYLREEFTEKENLRYSDKGAGRQITVITYGRTTRCAHDASVLLSDTYRVKTVSLKKVKPIDYNELWSYCEGSELIYFVEEQIKTGGVSEMIISELVTLGKRLPLVEINAIDEDFPTHASLSELYKHYGMDGEGIARKIREIMK